MSGGGIFSGTLLQAAVQSGCGGSREGGTPESQEDAAGGSQEGTGSGDRNKIPAGPEAAARAAEDGTQGVRPGTARGGSIAEVYAETAKEERKAQGQVTALVLYKTGSSGQELQLRLLAEADADAS